MSRIAPVLAAICLACATSSSVGGEFTCLTDDDQHTIEVTGMGTGWCHTGLDGEPYVESPCEIVRAQLIGVGWVVHGYSVTNNLVGVWYDKGGKWVGESWVGHVECRMK